MSRKVVLGLIDVHGLEHRLLTRHVLNCAASSYITCPAPCDVSPHSLSISCIVPGPRG